MTNPEAILRAAGIPLDQATKDDFAIASRIFFSLRPGALQKRAVQLFGQLSHAKDMGDATSCYFELERLLASGGGSDSGARAERGRPQPKSASGRGRPGSA